MEITPPTPGTPPPPTSPPPTTKAPTQNPTARITGALLALLVLAGTYILLFHRDWIKPSHVEEDEETAQTIVPVHTAKITRATLHRYIDGYGLVTPEPAHHGKAPASAQLAAPVAGVLTQANCAEGDHVQAGAPLFQLDIRAALADEQKSAAAQKAAQIGVTRFQTLVEFAEREYQRTKQLNKTKLASDRDLLQAELHLASAKDDLIEAQAKAAEAQKILAAASTQRSLLTIKAPLSGTVVHIYVNPGEAVDATKALATIIDLDRLVVSATVPAAALDSLKEGQSVELTPAETTKHRPPLHEDPTTNIAEGNTYPGTLTFIGFDVDPRTDAVPIRVSFPKDAKLRPGQYMHLRVAVAERKDRLAVPLDSVVKGPDGTPIIAIVEGEQTRQVPVHTGLREHGLIEIEGQDLEEGLTVVTAGAYGLPQNSRVRVLDP